MKNKSRCLHLRPLWAFRKVERKKLPEYRNTRLYGFITFRTKSLFHMNLFINRINIVVLTLVALSPVHRAAYSSVYWRAGNPINCDAMNNCQWRDPNHHSRAWDISVLASVAADDCDRCAYNPSSYGGGVKRDWRVRLSALHTDRINNYKELYGMQWKC